MDLKCRLFGGTKWSHLLFFKTLIIFLLWQLWILRRKTTHSGQKLHYHCYIGLQWKRWHYLSTKPCCWGKGSLFTSTVYLKSRNELYSRRNILLLVYPYSYLGKCSWLRVPSPCLQIARVSWHSLEHFFQNSGAEKVTVEISAEHVCSCVQAPEQTD